LKKSTAQHKTATARISLTGYSCSFYFLKAEEQLVESQLVKSQLVESQLIESQLINMCGRNVRQ
jgi:hypothetical protein